MLHVPFLSKRTLQNNININLEHFKSIKYIIVAYNCRRKQICLDTFSKFGSHSKNPLFICLLFFYQQKYVLQVINLTGQFEISLVNTQQTKLKTSTPPQLRQSWLLFACVEQHAILYSSLFNYMFSVYLDKLQFQSSFPKMLDGDNPKPCRH